MILEGICTTLNEDGTTNVAPMGPIVDQEFTSFLFRPFQTSTTFSNLKRTRCGVFHVTDDVGMIAKAAVGKLIELPEILHAQRIKGSILSNACRWYEFEVVSIDDSQPRSEIQTKVVNAGRLRDFFGLSRAKHAVLETAILATRLHLLKRQEIEENLKHYKIIIEKTAGPAERAAYQFLIHHIDAFWKAG